MGQSRPVGVVMLGMVALRVLAIQIGQFFGVIGVGLIRRPAGRQHDPLHDLVVGHVGLHALQQPVVPFLAGPLIDGRDVRQRPIVVARDVAQPRGPPGDVRRTRSSSSSTFLCRLSGDLSARNAATSLAVGKRAGDVEARPPQELRVAAQFGRHDRRACGASSRPGGQFPSAWGRRDTSARRRPTRAASREPARRPCRKRPPRANRPARSRSRLRSYRSWRSARRSSDNGRAA